MERSFYFGLPVPLYGDGLDDKDREVRDSQLNVGDE